MVSDTVLTGFWKDAPPSSDRTLTAAQRPRDGATKDDAGASAARVTRRLVAVGIVLSRPASCDRELASQSTGLGLFGGACSLLRRAKRPSAMASRVSLVLIPGRGSGPACSWRV